jgi:hypothetical protein
VRVRAHSQVSCVCGMYSCVCARERAGQRERDCVCARARVRVCAHAYPKKRMHARRREKMTLSDAARSRACILPENNFHMSTFTAMSQKKKMNRVSDYTVCPKRVPGANAKAASASKKRQAKRDKQKKAEGEGKKIQAERKVCAWCKCQGSLSLGNKTRNEP